MPIRIWLHTNPFLLTISICSGHTLVRQGTYLTWLDLGRKLTGKNHHITLYHRRFCSYISYYAEQHLHMGRSIHCFSCCFVSQHDVLTLLFVACIMHLWRGAYVLNRSAVVSFQGESESGVPPITQMQSSTQSLQPSIIA